MPGARLVPNKKIGPKPPSRSEVKWNARSEAKRHALSHWPLSFSRQ